MVNICKCQAGTNGNKFPSNTVSINVKKEGAEVDIPYVSSPEHVHLSYVGSSGDTTTVELCNKTTADVIVRCTAEADITPLFTLLGYPPHDIHIRPERVNTTVTNDYYWYDFTLTLDKGGYFSVGCMAQTDGMATVSNNTLFP